MTAPTHLALPMTANGITFLSSDPPVGSTIPIEGCEGDTQECATLGFTFTFAVDTWGIVEARLRDSEGHTCASGSEVFQSLAGEQPRTLYVHPSPWTPTLLGVAEPRCDFDVGPPGTRPRKQTTTVDVSISAPGRAPATASFPVPYTLTAPSLSPSPTSPKVTSLALDWLGLGQSRLEFVCKARDDDGDPLLFTLTFVATKGRSGSWRRWTDPRTSSIEASVVEEYGYVDDNEHVEGLLTCRVEDTRARSDSTTMRVCVQGQGRSGCP